MLRYFLIRLVSLVPKLLIISIIIFIGLEILPGDPISRTIPMDVYEQMSEKQIADLREAYGLNDPMAIRYFKWLGRMLQGDLGYSLTKGSSISEMLAARLPATLELAVSALIIATFFGLLLGFISAIKQNSPIDYANTLFGMIGISVPEFFVGLCAIIIFALRLGWFPTGGRIMYGKEAFLDRLEFLVLPSVCLGISYIAALMRLTRSSMLDVLNKDYIKTARSKGLSESEVNAGHGFRNALIPIMVVLVMRLPILVSGSVVIESVFNISGMGSMLLDAISGTDMPVVMITTMILSMVILSASFISDIVTAMLDPRIRFGR